MTEHDDTPRDAALTRRYREAGNESGDQAGMAPPPALDAHILAAARAAVQSSATENRSQHARPRAWWQRLSLPIGVMATTLLAVMLSLTVQRHTPETLEHERAAAKVQPAPATERAVEASAAPAVAPAAVPGARNDSAQRPAEKKAVQQPVAPAAPAAFPAPAASGVPGAAPSQTPAPATAAPAITPAPAASSETATVSRLKAESTNEARAGSMADRAQEPEARALQQKAAPAAAAPAPLGAAHGEAVPTASAWLEEIRELKRQGRDEAAARRLAEFRKAYPGYALPEDLK
ncbi:MAG TPA: hypothetical protein PLE72_06475 [Azospira sp.]|nr:hypothetical protein [Azospira sp.]HNN08610.1 hypothetical protein [Azospira sp.]HNN45573.1 hypothetical protein [Azospira sp.]